MFKFIRNKNGFGLVEVLMAAGLAGGIALTIAKLSQDANRVTKTTESNNEINMMMNDVAYILSDKANCRASVMGGSPSIPANGTVVSEIRRVDPPPAASSRVVYQTGTKYGNGTFTINSMMTEKDTTTNEVRLVLNVTRNNAVANGAKQITKRIPLKVVLDGTGNNVTSCFSDTDNMIAAAARAACHGNSARWDAAQGQCHHDVLISPAGAACPVGQALKLITTGVGPDNGDSATFTCQPVMGTSSCPAGQYLSGFDAAGAPLCTPMAAYCGDGNYIKVLSSGAYQCVQIPNCSILKLDPATRQITCADLTCGPNQYLTGFNSSGGIRCVNIPSNNCGPGQYVKRVNADGSIECQAVPAAATLAQQDYSFADGYDAGTSTWSRKTIDQTAAQVCSRITGFIWNGTTCTPSTGGVTDFAGICAKFPGHEWTGTQCRPNTTFNKIVAFQLRFNGTSWSVGSTRIIFSDNANDRTVPVVIDSATLMPRVGSDGDGGARYNFRIHHNNYYMDSAEVLNAQLIGPRGPQTDGNKNMKVSVTDISGNNEIELVKSDDATDNRFQPGDVVNIIWATPRM